VADLEFFKGVEFVLKKVLICDAGGTEMTRFGAVFLGNYSTILPHQCCSRLVHTFCISWYTFCIPFCISCFHPSPFSSLFCASHLWDTAVSGVC
jgi:hypothetical protein